MEAWERYGKPRRELMEELRRAIAYSRLHPEAVSLRGAPVSEDSKGQKAKKSAEPSYALKLHVRGVIHVQVERVHWVVGPLLTSIASAIVTLLAAAGIHVH